MVFNTELFEYYYQKFDKRNENIFLENEIELLNLFNKDQEYVLAVILKSDITLCLKIFDILDNKIIHKDNSIFLSFLKRYDNNSFNIKYIITDWLIEYHEISIPKSCNITNIDINPYLYSKL